ncbi:uncharacterized protein [Coffea arabica]|uniref:Helicase ATP-binding domain-containing protein n=1 Tax=Coffea arabica TaxID=13443 RepID=A0A6P6UN37_COFAR
MKETKCSPPTPLTTQPINPNPNSCKSTKNVIHIGGIQVEFPYQPYGTQLAFMNRVISTLDRARRDGHCHALLESPTGTGKSLSLLCSSLAWQQNFKSRNLQAANLSCSDSKPNPEAINDPINFGGGFVPETQPLSETGGSAAVNGKNKKKQSVPTIFYASRTHSQIRQVIQEYRKTTYRVPMAVLASRRHYCTNMNLRGTANIDEQCKLLLKDTEIGCSEFKNVHKVKGHPSLQKGGCHEVHDIEDLVKVGEIVKGCSYFAARSIAEDAELVFCPYNYIICPIIRKAMEVDIEGAIIILDEAHNIEDIARDAGSIDVEEDVLLQLQTELQQLRLTDPMTYQPLLEMIQDILNWIDRRKSTLEKREFQHYFSCWTGDKALMELEDANVTQKCFPILKECATKAIKAVSDAEPELACLSGISATVLEGLFSSFTFFFSGNGLHVNDYLLALQRYVKRDGVNSAGGWTHSLNLWCLNPSVVFKGIADASLSVILTSGTLSPMNSFSSELGIQFATCLEAPHVIETETQIWAGVISRGPQDYPLNASYRTAGTYAFQDAVGMSLEEICKIAPGGCLVFFPSYKLMEKLCSRWQETGQWSKLNAQKSLFVEPRGGSQDGLEPVLEGYYNSIHQKSKPLTGRKRRCKKLDVTNGERTESSQTANGGAAFLAVCRGKISEGIDFSDDYARVVVIVGIPFPNVHDIQVAQKKKFNDMYRLSKSLLSGNEWYCNQAFRALNQATGRCIRHRYDYGAIILLDERLCEERNRAHISKWFRKSIRQYDNFERSMEELKSFFRDAKDRVGKVVKSPQSSDLRVEDTLMVKNKVISTKKSQSERPFKRSEQKISGHSLASENSSSLYPSVSYGINHKFSQKIPDVEGLLSTDGRDIAGCREYIDLECDTQKHCRLSMSASTMLSPVDPDITIVRETPGVIGIDAIATSEVISINEDSSLTAVPLSSEIPDNFSCSPVSLVNSSLAFKSTCLLATPERTNNDRLNVRVPEMESPYNLSANSFSLKRRKSMRSSSDHIQKVEFGSPDSRTPDSVSFMVSSITKVDPEKRNGIDSQMLNLNKENGRFFQPSSFNDTGTSCAPDPTVVKRLQIFCSVCKNPLGLPENNLCVASTLTSCSKIYLRSLLREKLESSDVCSSSIPVLVTDKSSVDQQFFERNNEAAPAGPVEGIWCKADGCVFSTIFCPFCLDSTTCLGVQVMATDASNVCLQNKVLLFSDLLEIKSPTASITKELSSSNGSCTSKRAGLNSIEKYAYIPEQKNSGGWRTTKSKMQLPKRGLLSTPES